MTEISINIPASEKPDGKATFVMLGTGFDEIEAIAPVDVMRRAGMKVYTVSMTENRLVRGATGNNIVADMTVADLNPSQIDWLVFPGADKCEAAVNIGRELQNTIKKHWENGGKIAAICAAPALVLGPLGILSETPATGYPFLKEEFKMNGGSYSDDDVVVSDRLITSKGPGTTIEFALAIVEKAKGEEAVKALRDGMVIV
jgi:DJ-1 family protein